MKTRYDVSYWIDRCPAARHPGYPALSSDLDVDVAIVGGGMAGSAAAYAFASAGERVALFEANRIGQGSSGLCSGLVRLEPAVPLTGLQERLGRKAARSVWTACRRAGLDLGAVIRRLHLGCEFVSDAALRVGRGDADEKWLQREWRAQRSAGVEGTLLTAARLKQETGLEGVGALRSAGDGYIDPYRVALGLAAAASGRKAQIFERSAVSRVESNRHGAVVAVNGRHVRARTVVVASSYPPPAYKPLRRHFRLVQTSCVLTATLPSYVRREFGRSRAIVIDRNDPAHLLRRTSDDRLLAIGVDQPISSTRVRRGATERGTRQLMYELSRLYPAMAGVEPEYAWSVPVSLSMDGLPVIGPHRNYPRHLFALGLGHNGLGTAWLAARALVRHHQGQASSDDTLFGFARLR